MMIDTAIQTADLDEETLERILSTCTIPLESRPIDLLKHFRYQAHKEQIDYEVARDFAQFAVGLAMRLPSNAERTVAIRKLLESLDASLRSLVP